MGNRQRSNPAWRQFERLVAHLEASLGPSGAIIKSPDLLPDKFTGQLREVDGSIRYKVGSSDVLLTIECRKRQDKQDIQWIEQLITKKRRIGAMATLAVSLKGFSPQAVNMALQENIIPRKLSELVADDLNDWLNLAFHELEIRTLEIKRIALKLWDPSPDDKIILDEKLKEKFKANPFEYPLFVKSKDGSRYSAFEPLKMAEMQGANHFDGCIPGQPLTRTLKWENHDRGICVSTTNGMKPVRYIYIEFETLIEKKRLPISSYFRYSAEESPFTEGVSFDLSKVGEKGVLTLQRDIKTKELSVVFTIKQEEVLER
jgi:hypothetical protein